MALVDLNEWIPYNFPYNNSANVNKINNGTPAIEFDVEPNVNNVSERVGRILQQFNIDLSHRPTSKIRNTLCNFKDNHDPPNQSGVVYEMSCNDCDAVYIVGTS